MTSMLSSGCQVFELVGERIAHINRLPLQIDTTHIDHPSGNQQGKARIRRAGLEMMGNGFQCPLRQLLAAIHGDLPGAVANIRIAIAPDQSIGIGIKINPLGGFQCRGLLFDHQGMGSGFVSRITHGIGDGLIPGQIAQIGKEGVGAVQHPQLHIFIGQHIVREGGSGQIQSGRPETKSSSITHWRKGSQRMPAGSV